jgi:cob(I)alamin adenosyltransferase
MVFTGDGKGKTTAALGQALRALGWGKRVLLVQFLKGAEYGELKALKEFKDKVRVVQSGPSSLVHDLAKVKEKGLIEKTFAEAKKLALSGQYQLVILDEVNFALSQGFLSLQEVMAFLDELPEGVDILLTGRDAPKEIIRRARLVTEMRKVKHHYDEGAKAQKGVEY